MSKQNFNNELNRHLSEVQQIDMSTVMQAIERAAANCFTTTPAAQRQAHISDRTWQKIVNRNLAHEQNDWATVAQLNSEIKRDAKQDKRRSLLNTLEQCRSSKEKWEGPKLLNSNESLNSPN